MSRWNVKAAKFSFSRLRPLARYQARNIAPEREGGELARGDAGHAEFRQAEQSKTEAAADRDLDDGDADQHDRGDAHVAGAAHHRGQRVDQPDRYRAGEQHVRILHRLFEHAAAAAEQRIELPAERQHHHGEEQSGAGADHRRMQRQRRGAVAVAGAERAADGGRDAAAHRARRHHLRQHHERKHQRDPGQRLGAEPADIGGLGDRNQRGAEHRDRIGQRELQQRRQDRRGQQAVDRRGRYGRGARVKRGVDGHASPVQVGQRSNILWPTYYRPAQAQATHRRAGVTMAGRIGRWCRRAGRG